MLSYNDKWWMLHYDQKYHTKYGSTKREQMSCVPSQLRDGMWHKYSGRCKYRHNERVQVANKGSVCKYCNGEYDDTIERELGLSTRNESTSSGPRT